MSGVQVPAGPPYKERRHFRYRSAFFICYDGTMDLETITLPGIVIESVEYVMDNAVDVTIDDASLRVVADKISERLSKGIDTVEDAFGSTGVLEQDVNLIFFETACNFYFWNEDDATKWKVNVEGRLIGGWYGLTACFNKALKNNIPVYDAAWMARLTPNIARNLFAGNDMQIPLLEQRVNNIVEMANFLLQEHDGQAINFIAANHCSAPHIAEEIVRALPSFRDGAFYKGRWVWILKRAQILPSDVSQLAAKYPEFAIADADKLTAFADYRIPQVLRHFGAISYSDNLAGTVNSSTILPVGSSQEIEIRAATVVACERLKQYLPGTTTSADIDLGLWLISQDIHDDPTLLPHHRTPGYFY